MAMTFEEVMAKIEPLPDRVSKNKPYSKASYWKENWNRDYYLRCSVLTGAPYQKIVSTFLLLKGTPLDNYDQVNYFFTRNEQEAKKLVGFPLEKIEKVYKYLDAKMGSYRIALETIGKYLEEDIDSLAHKEKGEEAILILRDGEQIYDITRIKALEQQNRIYYQGGQWRER